MKLTSPVDGHSPLGCGRPNPLATAIKNDLPAADHFLLAEEEGFEPSVPFPVRQFSRLLPSTTRSPFPVTIFISTLAEREGFEPSLELSPH